MKRFECFVASCIDCPDMKRTDPFTYVCRQTNNKVSNPNLINVDCPLIDVNMIDIEPELIS